MSRRLFVTGGAGFIGSHYVRSLLTGAYPGFEDAEVTVFDKLTYAGNLANLAPVADTPRYRFVRGDICDPAALEAALPGHDAVVNFAAETHVDRSITGAADFAMTNFVGAQQVFDAALRHRVGKVVHVSTDEVYGTIPEGSWTEDHLLEPNSPYSAAKAGADLLARAYARTYGLDISVTRCSNNYGPYQFPEKVIPLFVTNLIDGQHGPAVRRRAQRPRLAARRRPLPRHPAGARAGRAGGVLQHRRRPGADQQGADRAAAGGDRHRTGSRSSTSPTGSGTTGATRSTTASWPRWATGRGTRSRTGWPRRSAGTGTTGPGGSR